jgi:hypothetical protein
MFVCRGPSRVLALRPSKFAYNRVCHVRAHVQLQTHRCDEEFDLNSNSCSSSSKKQKRLTKFILAENYGNGKNSANCVTRVGGMAAEPSTLLVKR